MVDRKRQFIQTADAFKDLPIDTLMQLAQQGRIVLATQAGYKLLEAQIGSNRASLHREIANMKEAAIANPDLPENPEFMDSRVKIQFQLPKEFSDLSQTHRMTVVAEPQSAVDSVGFGSGFTVSIQYPQEPKPETERYVLLGPLEVPLRTDRQGRRIVSYASQLGKAVTDKKQGESFNYEAFDGSVAGKILTIE